MEYKEAAYKAWKSLSRSFPVLFGVLILLSIFNALVPKSFYAKAFTGNLIIDPFIGSTIGSILAGNPITSYVIGGEFLKHGISLVAVTSFIVAWVTVGLVQLPAESILLGKKFAIYRNITAFFLSIAVAIVTYIFVVIL